MASYNRPDSRSSPLKSSDPYKGRSSHANGFGPKNGVYSGNRKDIDSARATSPYHGRSQITALDNHSSATAPRHSFRSQRSWPPNVSCEDEGVSLAREAHGGQHAQDVVPARGTINQEPIIQEVDTSVSSNAYGEQSKSGNRGQDCDEWPKSCGSSQVEEDRNTPAPELLKRTSMPYSFSSEIRDKPRVSLNGESSQKRTDPAERSKRPFSLSARPIVRVDARRYSMSNRSDSDDTSLSNTTNGRHRFVPPPFDMVQDASTTSRQDFAYKQSTTTDEGSASTRPKRPDLDHRRYTDVSTSPSWMSSSRAEPSRLNMSQTNPGILRDRGDNRLFTESPTVSRVDERAPSRHGTAMAAATSRGLSPVHAASQLNHSPHRSPRSSNDSILEKRPGSSCHTQTSSLPGSRHESPSTRGRLDASRYGKAEIDWSTLMAAKLASQQSENKFHPSLSRQDTMSSTTSFEEDQYPPPLRTKNGRADALPYPEEYQPTVSMPTESDHQYRHETRPNRITNIYNRSEASATINSSTHRGTTSLDARPPALRRSSTAATAAESRPCLQMPQFLAVEDEKTRAQFRELSMQPFVKCCEPHTRSKYDDWYSLIGASDIYLCATCVNGTLEGTLFRSMVRRARSKYAADARCALGVSAWVRFAWLFTLQQYRADLLIVRDIALIENTSDPCLNGPKSSRSWYGLRGPQGSALPDFCICRTDVDRIETLLPLLRGQFIRLSGDSVPKQVTCSMYQHSNRFSDYINAFLAAHESASSQHSPIDTTRVGDLIKRKTQLPECRKDDMLIDESWHFMSELPEFTVCKECFETIIRPEIDAESTVAQKFNQNMQKIRGEKIGTSCQLYSPRMRRLLQSAIEYDDIRKLRVEAVLRREKEVQLQRRARELLLRLKSLTLEGDDDGRDARRYKRELVEIRKEWQMKWE